MSRVGHVPQRLARDVAGSMERIAPHFAERGDEFVSTPGRTQRSISTRIMPRLEICKRRTIAIPAPRRLDLRTSGNALPFDLARARLSPTRSPRTPVAWALLDVSGMDVRTRAEFVQAFRRQRATLLKRFVDGEADLRWIAEDREPELEERAQEERAARILAGLDDRSLREIAEIHGALQRIIVGTFGKCLDCGRIIPVARLRAVPTAGFCIDCAREEEVAHRPGPVTLDQSHTGMLPADLDFLLDHEVEETLRELVRRDGRVDMEELRVVCRHGVIRLGGTVPSEAEHRVLMKLVTDVAGCQDVVDRVQVNELLWERPDRSRPAPRERTAPPRFEPIGTEDIVESREQGLGYLPPDGPPADEE